MNARRKALRLLLGGVAAWFAAPARAAQDIDVYFSPD